MKHLFENWGEIEGKIQQAKNLFLFLDYDGTLSPIVSRPEQALCPLEVKKVLEKLRDVPGVYLAIISGRSLKDLHERIGVRGITYVGNHGLEMELPDGRHKKIFSPIVKKELRRITENLRNSLEEIPGILLEEKGPTVSIHYRNVPEKFLVRIHEVLEKELDPWRDHWEMALGKMVREIRPRVDMDKGKAVRELLRNFPPQGLLTIYLGDDQTDEDAFRVLKGQGISVFVGSGSFRSDADFFLRSPEEVQEFLIRCQAARRTGKRRLGSP